LFGFPFAIIEDIEEDDDNFGLMEGDLFSMDFLPFNGSITTFISMFDNGKQTQRVIHNRNGRVTEQVFTGHEYIEYPRGSRQQKRKRKISRRNSTKNKKERKEKPQPEIIEIQDSPAESPLETPPEQEPEQEPEQGLEPQTELQTESAILIDPTRSHRKQKSTKFQNQRKFHQSKKRRPKKKSVQKAKQPQSYLVPENKEEK